MCRRSVPVQMVWEKGCVVIVMLTPLSENGVRQCHPYWPDEGSSLHHVYEVPRPAPPRTPAPQRPGHPDTGASARV